jgi:hypothetical protein
MLHERFALPHLDVSQHRELERAPLVLPPCPSLILGYPALAFAGVEGREVVGEEVDFACGELGIETIAEVEKYRVRRVVDQCLFALDRRETPALQ